MRAAAVADVTQSKRLSGREKDVLALPEIMEQALEALPPSDGEVPGRLRRVSCMQLRPVDVCAARRWRR